MSDIIDKGNEAAAVFLDASLSKRYANGPPPKGECYNCAETLDYPERWCDADCRDDWEKRKRAKLQSISD